MAPSAAEMQFQRACSDPAAVFYGVEALAYAVIWIVFRAWLGIDIFSRPTIMQNVLRPSWLPVRAALAAIHPSVYLPCAYSLVPLLVWAALEPQSLPLRALVAVAATGYSLGDSARTSSHRDYLLLYNAWGLALDAALGGQDVYARGLSFGLVIAFVLLSGAAKLAVGGLQWSSPRTMRGYLQTYGGLPRKEFGPASFRLNRFVCDHDAIAGACAGVTLLLECTAPLALMLPPAWRVALLYGMLLLHVGIALVQSVIIGLAFLPGLASYVFGLGHFAGVNGTSLELDVRSSGWWLALGVVLASVLATALRRRLLPEDWPLSHFGLFPWNGAQWELLQRHFVRETRMLLTVATVTPEQIVGRQLWNAPLRSEPMEEDGVQLHDFWDRILGDTPNQVLIVERAMQELPRMAALAPGERWDPQGFAEAVEDWLCRTGRLVEISSRLPITRAFLVTTDCDGRVQDIVCAGGGSARRPLLLGACEGG